MQVTLKISMAPVRPDDKIWMWYIKIKIYSNNNGCKPLKSKSGGQPGDSLNSGGGARPPHCRNATAYQTRSVRSYVCDVLEWVSARDWTVSAGDVAFRFIEFLRHAQSSSDSHVTVCDINEAMLDVGKRRAAQHHCRDGQPLYLLPLTTHSLCVFFYN